MLGDILQSIRDAEAEAAAIVSAAEKKAQKIDEDAAREIEKIRADAEDEAMKILAGATGKDKDRSTGKAGMAEGDEYFGDDEDEVEIIVDPKVLAAIEKFIETESKKWWPE